MYTSYKLPEIYTESFNRFFHNAQNWLISYSKLHVCFLSDTAVEGLLIIYFSERHDFS